LLDALGRCTGIPLLGWVTLSGFLLVVTNWRILGCDWEWWLGSPIFRLLFSLLISSGIGREARLPFLLTKEWVVETPKDKCFMVIKTTWYHWRTWLIILSMLCNPSSGLNSNDAMGGNKQVMVVHNFNSINSMMLPNTHCILSKTSA
jgi:hypothetical protein